MPTQKEIQQLKDAVQAKLNAGQMKPLEAVQQILAINKLPITAEPAPVSQPTYLDVQNALNANQNISQNDRATIQAELNRRTATATPTITPTTTPTPVATSITGNETLDGILDGFKKTLDSLTASGNIINPKVAITPEILSQFTNQVSAELDPYYKQQFDAVKTDLQDDWSSLNEQYKQSVKATEANFKQSLDSQRESEAGAGTIFSGGRIRRENDLTQSAQRTIDSLRNSLNTSATNLGKTAERKIGSTALSGLSAPTYQNYSVSNLGEGQYVPIDSRSLYTPTSGITGSLEREQIEKKRSYLDLLKNNYLAEQNI